MKMKTDPLNVQEGGDHYKSQKIQPVEYIHANGIGFMEGCVIKYVSRYKRKNELEDLKKARHFLDLLISLEYPEREQQVEPMTPYPPTMSEILEVFQVAKPKDTE